jgi:hypothetical protein
LVSPIVVAQGWSAEHLMRLYALKQYEGEVSMATKSADRRFCEQYAARWMNGRFDGPHRSIDKSWSMSGMGRE